MRDTGIDAYRCLLMFGICLLHAIVQGGHNVPWAANMFSWCVTGFAFISGWFGIRFSIGKVLKLYGISLYCATMFVMFDMFVSGGGGNFLITIYKMATSQWYLNAYVVVMCIAPIINLASDRITVKELFPLLLCAFGWSFATTLPYVGGRVPHAHGLEAYSFLTLLGAYVAARTLRMLDNNGKLNFLQGHNAWILMGACLCLMMSALGLNDFNSPFSLLLAGGFLLLMRNLKMPHWLGHAFAWLGPSMFSVYLLHSHEHAWKYLKVVQDWSLSIGMPLGIAYLVTAMTVFLVCILADVPRRIFAAGTGRFFKTIVH